MKFSELVGELVAQPLYVALPNRAWRDVSALLANDVWGEIIRRLSNPVTGPHGFLGDDSEYAESAKRLVAAGANT